MKIFIVFEKGYTFLQPIINSVWLNKDKAIDYKIYIQSHGNSIYFLEEFETEDEVEQELKKLEE